MLHLEVPRRATIGESSQLTRLVLEAERESGTVELDCAKTEVWGPVGAALIASCVAIRRKSGKVTQLLEPKETDLTAAAFQETGLSAFARDGVVGMQGGQVRTVDLASEAVPSQPVSVTSLAAAPSNEVLPALVQTCLGALLDNLRHWSESSVGGFIVERWSKKGHHAKIALVDRGVGIPAALRRATTSSLHRALDVDLVEAACSDPQVTSHENGRLGYGLKLVRDTVLSHQGRLTVVSLGAKVTWTTGKTTKTTSPALRGTAIELELSA
jgi:signal transduction histidine kinase